MENYHINADLIHKEILKLLNEKLIPIYPLQKRLPIEEMRKWGKNRAKRLELDEKNLEIK